MKIELYSHNAVVFEKVKAMMKQTGKAAIIHPTGTGKSYIAFAFAEENPDAHIIWLAPNECIYLTQSRILYDQQKLRYPNITFMTYSWLYRNTKEIDDMKPDIIILDEFHRAGAPHWQTGVELLMNRYPKAKLLGLSATNVRYLDNQRDMAQEIFDGYIASQISLCEAMANGILPTPKYIVGVYRFEDKLQKYQDRIDGITNEKKKSISQKTMEKLRRMLDSARNMPGLFQKHITERNSRFIIFCSNIAHTYEMIGKAPEWFGGIDTNPHIYSVDSDNVKSGLELQRFIEDDSDHLKLLYSIDMLNEGIHVPRVDGIIMLRPTGSPTLYKQQIGRALSSGSKKQPVIFDLVNNFESLYGVESIKEEWQKLRGSYLRELKDETEMMEFEIIDELADCRMLIRNLERSLSTPWDVYYEAYAGFVQDHGKIRVPKRYVTKDGLLLGRWVIHQRACYYAGRLNDDKIQRLNLLGMNWKKEADEAFERWFELLCEFKKENGHTNVPRNYKAPTGENLSGWVNNLRANYKRGQLSTERKKMLDDIGFCWDIKKAMWEEGFQHAKKYYEQNRTLELSCKYICEDGFRLGAWLATQRKVREGKTSGNLTEEKIRRLDQIGMVWEKKDDDRFGRCVNAYVRYVREHGTPFVPHKYKDGDINLGAWVERQKLAYRAGRLDHDQIKRLEKAGFIWETTLKTWEERYQEAKAFYEERGSLVMSCRDLEKNNLQTLYVWILNQYKEYMKESHGNLTNEQVTLLENIYIAIRTKQDLLWERGYSALKEYVEKYGDTLVPCAYETETGYKLGKWITEIKADYRKGKLSEDKIRFMNEIGMEWGNTQSARADRFWQEMYGRAKRYYHKNGCLPSTTYVEEDGMKLGQWISQQRSIHRGRLEHSAFTKEREKMLEEIGMDW